MANRIIITFLCLLLIFPCIMFAQYRSDSIFYKSNWKVVRDDTLIIIKNEITKKIDTLFKNVYEDEDNNDPIGHSFVSEYQIIAIVGSLLSYQYHSNTTGFDIPHPTGENWYRTIDINTKEEVSLYNLFSGESILQALRKDKFIMEHVATSHPNDLDSLTSSLIGDCSVSFKDIFISYAITSIKKNSVNIEFGLTHNCELFAGNITIIDISLPKSAMRYKFFDE